MRQPVAKTEHSIKCNKMVDGLKRVQTGNK